MTWSPPLSFEEKLKGLLVPPSLYIRSHYRKEMRKGARETLKRERPNLLVEIEEKHTKTPLEQEIARVCAYGYGCFVLQNGTLAPFGAIDTEKHHRSPATSDDYVFNFIFLPSGG